MILLKFYSKQCTTAYNTTRAANSTVMPSGRRIDCMLPWKTDLRQVLSAQRNIDTAANNVLEELINSHGDEVEPGARILPRIEMRVNILAVDEEGKRSNIQLWQPKVLSFTQHSQGITSTVGISTAHNHLRRK